MKIKSLHLNNIRSYLDQKIEFPSSTTLLSGDIGSGKSSILLALEFALFGVSRGELSGESLLRKGEKQGFVELNFEIDKQNIIIRRTLKNSADRVAQGNGHLIINNSKEDATPIELKSRILDLLKYPQDSLTKKSLIYRYTVYTPQEEMKRILFDDKQLRLDTLRKVFNIDKYKTIQQNCAIYTKQLRNEIKIMKARIEDLPKKKTELESYKKRLVSENVKLNLIIPELETLARQLNEHKEKIKQLEEKVDQRRTLVQEIQIIKQKLHSDEQRKLRLERDKEETNKQIEELKEKAGQIQIKEVQSYSESLKQKIEDLDKKFREISNKINSLETQKRLIQENANSILNLNNCNVCKQEVSRYHKENVRAEANNNTLKLNAQIKELNTQSGSLEFERESIKHQLDEQIKLDQENKLRKQQKEFLTKQINDKFSLLERIEQEYNSLGKIFEELKAKINVGESKLDELPEIDLTNEKQLLNELINKTHQKDMEKLSLEKEIQNLTSRSNEIQSEIDEKEEIENKIKKIKKYHDWLQDLFTPLMVNMEKHVFSQVHHEFNSLFSSWFNILLEDENINTRLDDEFSPIIIQNGYEIDLSDLSGGEKTSIALAYRLALNKVITKLMNEIKTKDILILDEPTDGFSTDQLDKVRLVLDELNSGQVIIVSHENKIESFVDNVIKISKNEHVSSVG